MIIIQELDDQVFIAEIPAKTWGFITNLDYLCVEVDGRGCVAQHRTPQDHWGLYQ